MNNYEFEPKKKFKLGKAFFYKYAYVFILGLILLLGVSYSLTFFRQNYKVAEGSLISGATTILLNSNASTNSVSLNATNLTVPANIQDGIKEFSTNILLENTSNNNARIKLTLERTSGLELTDLTYALYINGTIQEIKDVPSNGVILSSTLMNSQIETSENIEVRLWPKTTYSGSATTFVGKLNLEKKPLTITGSQYVESSTLTANNNYAIKYASRNSHTDIVKLLIEAGADVTADDNEAIRLAVKHDHIEIMKLLIDAIKN